MGETNSALLEWSATFDTKRKMLRRAHGLYMLGLVSYCDAERKTLFNRMLFSVVCEHWDFFRRWLLISIGHAHLL